MSDGVAMFIILMAVVAGAVIDVAGYRRLRAELARVKQRLSDEEARGRGLKSRIDHLELGKRGGARA